MSALKEQVLDLTDFEEEALEVRDQKIKTEIAKKLLLKNMAKEEIFEITGITIEELGNIIKNMQQE